MNLIQVFILLFLERSQKMIWFPLALIVSLDFMIPLDGTEISHVINPVYYTKGGLGKHGKSKIYPCNVLPMFLQELLAILFL